jgi:hypothetical protein
MGKSHAMSTWDFFDMMLGKNPCQHGAPFPDALMRGSPDGTVEADRYRQATLNLAAKRE